MFKTSANGYCSISQSDTLLGTTNKELPQAYPLPPPPPPPPPTPPPPRNLIDDERPTPEKHERGQPTAVYHQPRFAAGLFVLPHLS
jgi:hypothetical protein